MRLRHAFAGLALILAAVSALDTAAAADSEAVTRGEYIFRAADCYSCHTDVKNKGKPLAGGRALKTPFGTFYTPNITPDPETGIGNWTEADFARALHEGIAPDGSNYFPAFPYPSFTKMTDEDVRDLKAYLDSVAPVIQANRPHDLTPPFGWRFLVWPWKWLFFEPGRFVPDSSRTESWNRGAYLADALAHCGECHTPRNFLGGPDDELFYAGTKDGPEEQLVPNITPDRETGIGRWSKGDITYLLKTGFKPDFDNVQGLMAEAISEGMKYLTDEDLDAIAEYLMSLPPIHHQVESKAKSTGSAFD